MDSVNTLHQLGILHGDIKLENFLILEDDAPSGNPKIKLFNFDYSVFIPNFRFNNEKIDEKKERNKRF